MLLERLTKITQGIDWSVVIIVLLLNAVGLVTLYGVTVEAPVWMRHLFWRQLLWLVLGLGGLFLVTSISRKEILRGAAVFYVIALILVALPGLLGIARKGAHSWLVIGKVSLQPAEFAKIALIILLSRFLSTQQWKKGLSLPNILLVGIITLIPSLIVALQPDLGSAVVFIFVALGLLFLAGIPRYMFLLLLLGLLLSAVLIYPHLKPYQKSRLDVFLHPWADSLNKGYNVVQAEIAIGSGKFWGKGLGKGSQTKYRFLPEHYTDFIFAGLVEQFGFIGGILVIFLYGSLIHRLQKIARRCAKEETYYLVCGTILLIATHIVLNIGMTMGLLPVTGLPLPWLSYGGSFLLTSYLTIGLALAGKKERYIFTR